MGPRSGLGSAALLLELDSLEILLVLKFLLNILVPLKKLVVFVVSDLQLFSHNHLLLFAHGVHLVLLLLDQFSFSGNNLFVARVHVFFILIFLQFLASDLYFMCFSIPELKLKLLNFLTLFALRD